MYDRYANRFVPRWAILVFDLLVIFFTFYVSFAVRLNFELIDFYPARETPQAFFVTLVYALSFLGFRSYSGIIRHTGLNDAFRVFQATAAAFVFLILFGVVVRIFDIHVPWTTSFAVLLIHFLLSYFILMGARIVVKTVFSNIMRARRKSGHRVIIFGAGSSGLITRNALVNDPAVDYDIVAFADDNPNKANKMLEGVPVALPSQVMNPQFVLKSGAGLVVISIQNLTIRRRNEIIEQALELGMEVKVVPPLEQWIHGQLSTTQLRKVSIEELMERERIVLDSAHVEADIMDKVVFVTGAAGSIGSEIARQVLAFNPRKLVLIDQAESGLFDLQFEIANKPALKTHCHLADYIVGNVKDLCRMQQLFERYRPDMVYHAAAYKHVPLMESFPYEALLVNVFGTRIIADLAVKYGVKKFVMVSTDKAVNPTNVMGASKRIAEMYTQSIGNETTQFITTRFGNVLDSSGSVIPLFRKQIEMGGPLTVTHKEITRFFMMISEACNLVLEAGAMGRGGEIFVFDMGRPVRIMDLAAKMIRLSGYEPGKDIMIQEVGLRPGEKLYEEVLNQEENTLPTYHPKILHARVSPRNHQTMVTLLDELALLIPLGDDYKLVAKMKEIVPEFLSENSAFQSLDKTTST